MKTQDILNWLEQEMTGENVSDVLLAVRKGWNRINPDDELILLSVPRNDPKRCKEVLEGAIELLERQKVGYRIVDCEPV